MNTPELIIQDFGGSHNGDLAKTRARLIKGGSWKKTIALLFIICILLVVINEETWLTVSGFPGYKVSSEGRIKSCLKKTCLEGKRGSRTIYGDHYHILKPTVDDIGRRFVTLYALPVIVGQKSIAKRFLVAALVLQEFVSYRPNGMIVRHGPNGHRDDSVSNVSWGTYSSNNGEDRWRDGTALKGEDLSWTKLSIGQIEQIRRLISKGVSALDIARMFNVTRRNIYYIKHCKTWKWLHQN